QVPKRRDADRDAVNNILKSAGNSEGYGEIMKQADPELVKEGMTAGIKEPAKDTRVVDFNLIAGTFGLSGFATDKKQADMAANALKKGATPQQIFKARERIAKGWKDDDQIPDLADDALCMSLSTPHEKSEMIKELQRGIQTDLEDRSLVSILSSSQD